MFNLFKKKLLIYRCTNALCCEVGFKSTNCINTLIVNTHFFFLNLFLLKYSLQSNMSSILIRLPFKMANNGVLYQKVLIYPSCLMYSTHTNTQNLSFIYFYKLFPTRVESFQTLYSPFWTLFHCIWGFTPLLNMAFRRFHDLSFVL